MKTLGVIGGGQLGRMMAHSASLLGIRTVAYSDSMTCPAKTYCDEICIGNYNDHEKILNFFQKTNYITIEFESVPFETLQAIATATPAPARAALP